MAVGGDLSTDRLLLAYSHGFFPWFGFKTSPGPIWYCPLERFVIFPNEIHISRSMKRLLNKGIYEFSLDRDFGAVIKACAETDGRDKLSGAWLGPDMIKAYTKLHELGFGMSLEVWSKEKDGSRKLVGGIYGVTLKGAFFGESMFSRVPSGSKMALIFLAQTMEAAGMKFIDCQFETPHLLSMGGRQISYDEYMRILDNE